MWFLLGTATVGRGEAGPFTPWPPGHSSKGSKRVGRGGLPVSSGPRLPTAVLLGPRQTAGPQGAFHRLECQEELRGTEGGNASTLLSGCCSNAHVISMDTDISSNDPAVSGQCDQATNLIDF